MIRKTLLLMSFLSLFGCGASHAPEFPTDTFTARDGSQFTMTFIKHGSLAIEVAGKHIYIDPVSEYADYATLPKADLILVTHSHYDHFDRTAIEALETPETDLLCDKTTAEAFDFDCHVMMPGDTARPRDYVTIEAVAAYNTSAKCLWHKLQNPNLTLGLHRKSIVLRTSIRLRLMLSRLLSRMELSISIFPSVR